MKFIDSDPYKKIIGYIYKSEDQPRLIQIVGYAYDVNKNKYIYILKVLSNTFGNKSEEIINYLHHLNYNIKYFYSNNDSRYIYINECTFNKYYIKLGKKSI